MSTSTELVQSLRDVPATRPDENSLERSFSFTEHRMSRGMGHGGLGDFLLYLGLGAPVAVGAPEEEQPEGPPREHADRQDECLPDRAARRASSAHVAAARSASGDFKFAEPRLYECGYCNSNFGDRKRYFRHLRKHTNILRCIECNKSFSHVIDKKSHQIRCRRLGVF